VAKEIQTRPQVAVTPVKHFIDGEDGVFSFEFYTEYQTIHMALGRHRIPRMGMRQP
jgi:hypothetical protein